MVNVDLSTCDGHVVIALRGELDMLDAANVAAELAAAVARDPDLIIDLTGLDFIDCSALGVLLRVQQLARQADGELLLAAPQQHVLRLLTLTGMNGVFSVHASAEQAAASGRRSPPAPVPTARLVVLLSA